MAISMENCIEINKVKAIAFTLFKRSLTLICFLVTPALIFCQENSGFTFGNVSAKDFDLSSSKVVNADDGAVILYAAGSTHFVGNSDGWFSYVYTCTKRIKIIHQKSFDLATIKLSLFTEDGDEETLSDVKAVTYNLDNGKVSSVEMDKNGVFSEKRDENHILKKFALPAVKEGCIIEYTYTITSPYIFNIPSWKFQNAEYPTVWSEYTVSIPVTLTYTSVKQGIDSFFINKSWTGKEKYKVKQKPPDENAYTLTMQWSVETSTVNHRWAQKNVKPLKAESYISSPENYVDKIEFQLSGTYNGTDSSKVMNTWKSVSSYFSNKKDFVQALTGDNSWIKDVPGTDNNNDLQTARSIYHYIQDNYTCTDADDIHSYADLYDVYKYQKGTVRDLNLLLIAMLKNKGVYAEPVILSTRDNGFVNPNYPFVSKFNYLICRTLIGGRDYLLDATNPELAFGELPAECYNGYARIIHANRSDSLYLLADSLKETEFTTLTLHADDDGKLSGTYKYTMGKITSVEMRKEMRTSNATAYFKGLKEEFPADVSITNTVIDSLDKKEMPVAVKYDISFKTGDDIIYFNPIAPLNMEKENPFKATQRSLPVEMPYCSDKTYILSMEVPKGYRTDELPKPARVSLNDNEGSFEYIVQQSGDRIQLRCRTKLNKANFEPEDYETLRNFFAFIVQKESEQIVFKKL